MSTSKTGRAAAKTPKKATTSTSKAPEEEKRERGRPRVAGGGGEMRRVNLSLDEETLAIATRVHSNTSAAVRTALAYWAKHHPEK